METVSFVLANLVIVGLIFWSAYVDRRSDAQSEGPFGIRISRRPRQKRLNRDELE
jgi:hypothetical protein